MSETQNWIAMGYIKGAFGIRGWVTVRPSTEYLDSLLDYPVWRLANHQKTLDVSVNHAQISGDQLHVQFNNVNNRNDAELLRGYTIYIERKAFASTEENEFYWADLVGMTVRNRDAVTLGKVARLLQTGAHDVLVVQGEYGEKLIPFVAHFIDHVKLPERLIIVDWGLDY